jgi:hypothetical protein
MYFHTAVVELFDPFRRYDTASGAFARNIADASMAQLRRLLYIQRYRYGGPPQASTTMHSIRVLAVDLLERISRAAGQADEECEFYIILCVDALMQVSSCYPFTKGILRDLVSRADAAGVRLPEEVLALFRGIGEACFHRPVTMIEEGRAHLSIDVLMAETDPSEAVMTWLGRVATKLNVR